MRRHYTCVDYYSWSGSKAAFPRSDQGALDRGYVGSWIWTSENSSSTAGCVDIDPHTLCTHNRSCRLFGGTLCTHHAIRVNHTEIRCRGCLRSTHSTPFANLLSISRIIVTEISASPVSGRRTRSLYSSDGCPRARRERALHYPTPPADHFKACRDRALHR